MLAYLLRRLFATIALVIAISTTALVLTRLAPGDYAQLQRGIGATAQSLAAERRAANLDQPLTVQVGRWIAGLARFDFGTSLLYGQPVAPIVRERAINTAALAVAAFAIALGLGIPAAFLTATRPRSLAARSIRVASLVLLSVPSFVGSLALVLLAVRTGWLPAGGISSNDVAPGTVDYALDVLWHLPVPVLALALPLAATFERLQSQALTEALAEPAVHAARARGVPSSVVIRRHAWRLSLKPVAAVGGLAIGALLSGSFSVELVTAWPGLGRLIVDALRARDLFLVAGCAAAGTFVLSLGLLAADVVIAWSDPRIRAASDTAVEASQ
jgi:peptide/nickel transport system permease protein